MWNKFIVYRENFTIKIYDYINKKLITQITTETSISPNISIVQDNKTHACFLLNYFGIAPQHFIILKEDGTYKDIIAHGDNGWIDATEDDAYIAYNKDKNPSPPRVILSEEWENEFIINSYDDYNLWSKVPVSELYDSSNFNNILRVKLITNIGVPVHWIGRVSEDKYLIRSWNKLYHLDKNLFNLEFIYDVSDLIHSSGSFTISIVPEKDGTVFICERYGYTNTYYCIYRSLDSGKSWTKVLDNIPEINISNGLICCGNGIIYFIAAYAMHTRCSIDNGSTWQSFSYGEAKDRGFPVYLLFPDDPESDLYDWGTDYGHCGYVSGKNIVYMRYTGESSSGTKISYDHGLSFSEWNNPPPWKTINKIVATKNGTILFASIIDEEGDYDLFRSESEGEWVSCGIPFVPLGLYEVAEGFVLITNNTQYLSNDKGVNWEQVDLIGFNRVFIDIYSIKNKIPVLKKRKEWIDHSLSQSQKIIGSGSLGKLYNNIFYFDGSAYNINANTIQINSGLEYSYDNLCLKKYLIYTTSDPKGGHVLFLKDLETSQKLILMQTEELGNGNAHFYPIHLATYFT